MQYGVRTNEHEVITSCDDLNDYHGEERVLLLVQEDDQQITMVGCETIHDMSYYISKDELLKNDDSDPEEWILLKVQILDPEDLPYDIEFGTCVYVIYEDDILFRAETMKEAVDYIEGMFNMGWSVYIDDFSVVSGLELNVEMKHRLKEFIDKFDELLAEGSPEVNEELSAGGQE
jgi:hypothetical protein